MQLRPYQEKAIAQIREAFTKYNRVVYVGPCGMGKTNLFVYIAKGCAEKNNSNTILVHRRELIKQTSDTLNRWGVGHGIISPDYQQTYDSIQVASVQTISRRLDRIHKPSLLTIDEGHHSVASSYMKVMNHFPDMKVLAVTASPCRMDGKGLGEIFDHMIIGPTTKELIDDGYLSDFVAYVPPTEIDLSKIHMRGGDYAIDELQAVMDKSSITGNVIEHYRKHVNGAPSIAFCTTVDHAKHVAEQFSSEGFRAKAVYGDMPSSERDQTMSELRNGELNVVTSSRLIDEGFDAPSVEAVILLRPTKSLAVHTQQCGRALRLCEGKSFAKIMDHVGNCLRLGLPTDPVAWTLEGKLKGPKKGPKQCSRCYKVFHIQPPCEDEECPSKNKNTTGRDDRPKEVDGELKAMQDPYLWAKGINIATAKGEEWKSLLHHTEGKYERLKQIQVLRNYHHIWVKRMMGEKINNWWSKKK